MHRVITTVLIAVGISGLALGQSAQSQNATMEKQIAQMEREFHQARLKNDAAAVNRFFAPDYYAINTGGERREAGNKAAGPFNTTPNGDRWEKVDIADQRVRVYGDSAVSTYTRHIDVRNRDGSSRQVNLVGSHVWARRDGRWLIVLSQATGLAQ
jgi:uncharacterized protein (TIGR02246 family)